MLWSSSIFTSNIRTIGECVQALMDAAVEEVKMPALTALHTGKSAPALVARR